MPRTVFSGHALTQAPDPMHTSRSITGWIVSGTTSPSAAMSSSVAWSAASRFRAPRVTARQTRVARNTAATDGGSHGSDRIAARNMVTVVAVVMGSRSSSQTWPPRHAAKDHESPGVVAGHSLPLQGEQHLRARKEDDRAAGAVLHERRAHGAVLQDREAVIG